MIDFMLDYKCFNDPIVISIEAAILPFKQYFGGKKYIIAMELQVFSLNGKMHFECMPFPASRFSLSFYEEPSIDLKIESSISGPQSLRQLAEAFIVKKIKLSILEKFLMPNRKYFPIPKSKELTEKYFQKLLEQEDHLEVEEDEETKLKKEEEALSSVIENSGINLEQIAKEAAEEKKHK